MVYLIGEIIEQKGNRGHRPTATREAHDLPLDRALLEAAKEEQGDGPRGHANQEDAGRVNVGEGHQ